MSYYLDIAAEQVAGLAFGLAAAGLAAGLVAAGLAGVAEKF